MTTTNSDVLLRYFSNTDQPCFALINLPETVKGALFARYSRSPKSLRQLFLDEFAPDLAGASDAGPSTVGAERAEKLYGRIFNDYGDDSVAQLGGVHLACENVSNLLTKVLERGRLAAYLEQSTRYIPYTDRTGGVWRYHVPAELDGHPLRAAYVAALDATFETYTKWIDPLREHFEKKYPKQPGDSDAVYRSATRAKALDTLRGLLPAATQSNVGIYATGQAYEALILRMRAHPLAEVRDYADLMLTELRKVIPAFLTRVDQPERGGAWTSYLADARAKTLAIGQRLSLEATPDVRPEVTLSDFDPDGEVKVIAAALYTSTDLPDDQLLEIARAMTPADRAAVLAAYVGDRTNRRHKPGRAFERTSYRFDILTDYGAFRDLQRHRLMTIDWQALTTKHGHIRPEAVIEAGAGADWDAAMSRSAELYDALLASDLHDAAQYAVSLAYRVRFIMDMNAREAMHVIELRTAPAGHPAYRRVCQQMHRLIDERAQHHAMAASMKFTDHSEIELERLQEERRLEKKRQERA
jgi:thymidylate synthase ThyX